MSEKLVFKELNTLESKVNKTKIPLELQTRIYQMISRLNRMISSGFYSLEFEIISKYIDWVTNIPWSLGTKDNLDIKNAKNVLDKNHYGLDYVKDRIIEYLAVRTLLIRKNREREEHSPIICLVGLQGTGKTTMAESVAEALGRKFIRISLGALGSTLELRGRNRSDPGSTPGQIIKSLVRTRTMNPLILLDELDKVSGERGLRADFMAVLLEILDPEQNTSFRDHYLDYPVDLSKVLFIASANNTGTFSAALMDRLEIITMPAYSDEEKNKIAKDFLLPKIIRRSGLSLGELTVDDNLWPKLIRPLGYDSGIRSLKRLLDAVARKTAKMIVEGKVEKVKITEDNYKEFLPRL